MARFCSNCGSPLTETGSFCGKCGTRVGTPPGQAAGASPSQTPPAPPPSPAPAAPSPAPPYPQTPPQFSPAPPQQQYSQAPPQFSPAPAAAQSGTGFKIVVAVVSALVVIGIAGIAGAIYVGHRVKQAVVEKAKDYGVDLNAIAADQASRSTSSASAARRKPCDYLSKDEVSRIIGQPIERAVPEEEGCEYFGPPGLAAKLGKEGVSTGMQQVQGDKQSNAQLAQGINNIINGIGSQGGDEKPLLLFAIDPDGKTQMTALDAAGAIFGQIPGAKPEEISGLGDRAVRFANLGLNVLKGSTVIRIVAGPIPDPDNKTVEIAKALLPLI